MDLASLRRARGMVLVLIAAVSLVLAGCSGESTPSSGASSTPAVQSSELKTAVKAVNDAALAKGYGLHALTVPEVLTWFEVAKSFELVRGEREKAWSQLQAGSLPDVGGAGQLAPQPTTSPSQLETTAGSSPSTGQPEVEGNPTVIGSTGYGFELLGPDDTGTGSAEIRMTPFNLPIVNRAGLVPYTTYLRSLLAPNLDLASEMFEGPPASDAATLDPVVQVRVTPIKVKGAAKAEPAQRAALQVMIRLAPDALEAATDYFGTGYGRKVMRKRLVDLLGDEPERWVDLAAVIPGWVGDKVNTFPSGADSDVCYGAAREFYAPQQDDRHNVSTEASSLLLNAHYCLLGEEVAPTFGDYLSVPNQHAGRYVLRDPATGRDVSFSVQSGGNAPYRFAWLNEDFSARPFAGVADPTVLHTRVDVWRRCR